MKLRPKPIREVNWRMLHFPRESARECARKMNYPITDKSVTKVRKQLAIFEQDGIDINELDDDRLLERFYPIRATDPDKIEPDFEYYSKELAKKGATKTKLYEMYSKSITEQFGDAKKAYSESSFHKKFKKHLEKTDLTLLLTHYAGEVLMVDYAGTTVPYFDLDEQVEKYAQVFVALLPVSQETFVIAVASQKTEDFIYALTEAIEKYKRLPDCIVVDNLKAAVIKPGVFPEFNRVLKEWAKHYGITIVAARSRKPQDKALVENGVKHITSRVLYPVRNMKHFSLADINQAIYGLLEIYNKQKMRRRVLSRREYFEQIERETMRPITVERFQFCEWITQQKVPNTYHVYVHNHQYSVPFHLVSKYVEARVTRQVVEFYHKHLRVATHVRKDEPSGRSTIAAHQPITHQKYAEQTVTDYLRWASQIGPFTCDAVRYQFKDRHESFVASKACSQLKKLDRLFGSERLEKACEIAERDKKQSATRIRSILQNKVDQLSPVESDFTYEMPRHSYIRGSDYYENLMDRERMYDEPKPEQAQCTVCRNASCFDYDCMEGAYDYAH